MKLSITIPIYNEEESIESLLERVSNAGINCDFELLLINDGSQDKSDEVIKRNLEKYPFLRYLSLARNMGQSTALSCGFHNSLGEYVVMMDGDLQNLPEDIPLLLEEIEKGYDLVSGRRTNRQEVNPSRKLPSKIANFLIRRVTHCEVKDMGGMNIVRGDIAREIDVKNGYHRIIPALVHLRGGKVHEIPIRHDKRHAGVSKYTTLSRSIEVMFDILLLWFRTASKARPIYTFGKASIFFLVSSLFIFLVLLYQRQFMDMDMGSRPLFIIDVIMFVTSLGLFSVGLIIELLNDLSPPSDKVPYIVSFDSKDS